MIPSLHNKIDESYDLSLRKVNNEIEIFALSLNSKETSHENSDNITLNVYSPVGSIQLGNYSTANVNQVINQDDKKELIKALNIVEKAIFSLPKITTFSKEEVLDIVQDSKQELSKEKPNKTKLRGFISTIGHSLQTVATLHSAYQAIKSAALFIGVSFP